MKHISKTQRPNVLDSSGSEQYLFFHVLFEAFCGIYQYSHLMIFVTLVLL